MCYFDSPFVHQDMLNGFDPAFGNSQFALGGTLSGSDCDGISTVTPQLTIYDSAYKPYSTVACSFSVDTPVAATPTAAIYCPIKQSDVPTNGNLFLDPSLGSGQYALRVTQGPSTSGSVYTSTRYQTEVFYYHDTVPVSTATQTNCAATTSVTSTVYVTTATQTSYVPSTFVCPVTTTTTTTTPPAVTTPPAPISTCLVQTNTDYLGGDYDRFPADTFDQCFAACQKDSRCVTAQFHKTRKYCYLKNALNSAAANTEVDSVICRTCTIEHNTEHAGGDYSAIQANSFDECTAACKSDVRCATAQFHRDRKYCYLKNAVNPASTDTSVDSIVCKPYLAPSKRGLGLGLEVRTLERRTTRAPTNVKRDAAYPTFVTTVSGVTYAGPQYFLGIRSGSTVIEVRTTVTGDPYTNYESTRTVTQTDAGCTATDTSKTVTVSTAAVVTSTKVVYQGGCGPA